MENVILFLVAIIPICLLAFWIYKKDKDKEPKNLLLKLFFSGLGSVIITLVISSVFSFIPIFTVSDDGSLFEIFLETFIGIALLEEFSKWIMVYKLSYKSPHFDEQYDAIVYACFVSLGFACFENILYVFEHGIGVGVMRALLSVPGHVSDGIFMGYFLGLAKVSDKHDDGKRGKYLFLSVLVPVILHGFYDFCVFSKNDYLLLAFFVFIIVLYVMSFRKINKIASIKGKIFYKDNFCPMCGAKVESNFCPYCGRKND